MDSAHIVPHKWPLYFICCILWIFYNKEFAQAHIFLGHTIPYQWFQYTICSILLLFYNKKTKLPALPQGPTSTHYHHNSLHHNLLWPNTLTPSNLTPYISCSICFVLLYNNTYTLLHFYQGYLYTICIISYYLHNQYNALTSTQYPTLSERTHTSSLPPNQKTHITKAPSSLILSIYFKSHNYLRGSITTTLILLLGVSYLYANKQSNSITYITNSPPQRDHTTNTILLTHQICTHPNYVIHSYNLTQ